MTQTSNTTELVTERQRTHGNFENNARISQSLKTVVFNENMARASRGQELLTAMQVEALEMICHKMGRILSGIADFQDHWDDIAGYAKIANGQL